MAEIGVPALMEHVGGIPIVYVPGSGDTVDLTGIVGPIETVEVETEHGIKRVQERDVTISVDPDSEWGGVAAPALNAVVTIAGQNWAIKSVAQTGNQARLRTTLIGIAERSRPGYRTRR